MLKSKPAKWYQVTHWENLHQGRVVHKPPGQACPMYLYTTYLPFIFNHLVLLGLKSVIVGQLVSSCYNSAALMCWHLARLLLYLQKKTNYINRSIGGDNSKWNESKWKWNLTATGKYTDRMKVVYGSRRFSSLAVILVQPSCQNDSNIIKCTKCGALHKQPLMALHVWRSILCYTITHKEESQQGE